MRKLGITKITTGNTFTIVEGVCDTGIVLSLRSKCLMDGLKSLMDSNCRLIELSGNRKRFSPRFHGRDWITRPD